MQLSRPPELSKERLTNLFDRLGLPPEGRRLVQRAMVEAPVRDVRSTGRNVVTDFHSRKNGCWIGTESRHVEFPAAVVFENDPKTLAYYPQPFTRVYEYVEPDTGEIHTVCNTPDFLVLAEDEITVIECKPQATLLKESQRRPFMFRQADDGTWFSPLLEEALGKLGLRYRIVTDQSFSRVWVENCQHLADYMGDAIDPCPEDTLAKVRALLREEGRMTIHELVHPPHNLSVDQILKGVVDGALVANLEGEPLYEPRCAWLYRDHTFRDFTLAQKDVYQPGKPSFVIDIAPGARFSYGDETLTVAFTSEKRVVLNGESGRTLDVARDWLLNGLDRGQIQSLAGADGGALRIQDLSERQLPVWEPPSRSSISRPRTFWSRTPVDKCWQSSPRG